MRYALLIVVAMTLGGCIRVFGTEYVLEPDPRQADYVTIKHISKQLLAVDGQTKTLLGISLDGLSPEEVQAFDKEMARVSRGLIGKEEDGRCQLLLPGHIAAPLNESPILFPTRKQIPPSYMDWGLHLISNGYAKANTGEIQDKMLAKQYSEAEEAARNKEIGIWKHTLSPSASTISTSRKPAAN